MNRHYYRVRIEMRPWEGDPDPYRCRVILARSGRDISGRVPYHLGPELYAAHVDAVAGRHRKIPVLLFATDPAKLPYRWHSWRGRRPRQMRNFGPRMQPAWLRVVA